VAALRTLSGPGGFTYTLDDSGPVEGYDRIRVGVRPEDITLVDDGENTAIVNVVEPMGNENFCYMELGGVETTARVHPSHRPAAGDAVPFSFSEEALYLFDPDTGEALKTKTDEATDVAISA